MNNVYGYIYKITNKVNGKIYIGQTIRSIEQRFREHCKPHNNETAKFMAISRAIKKYGRDNFIIESIDCALDKASLDEKEIWYITLLNSTNKKIGYNIASGGGSGNNFAGKTKEEYDAIKNKISNSLSRYWENLPDEDRYRLIADFRARTKKYMNNLTPEQRRKIGERLRNVSSGRKMSEETKDKLRKINTGRIFSKERLIKNSLKMKHNFVDQSHPKSRKQINPKQPLKSDSKTGEKNPMYGVRGENNKMSISIKCIALETGKEIIICGIQNASRQLMIPATKICAVLKGRRRTAFGYQFEYVGGAQ